jgi:hypothetical protein
VPYPLKGVDGRDKHGHDVGGHYYTTFPISSSFPTGFGTLPPLGMLR